MHLDINEYDFVPNIDHPEYPRRALDSSDITCEHFALSLFKDLKTSKERYLSEYNKRKTPSGRDKFKNQKGDRVVRLVLSENDGVSDSPNSAGHLSFFPYTSFNYLQCLKEIFNIFA